MGRATGPGERPWLDRAAGRVEDVIYAVVAALLAVAGVLLVVDLVQGLADEESIEELALHLLDRVLLLLIVAELLFSVRLVFAGAESVIEPFLRIGLIAVVRRTVLLTAEVENLEREGRALTNFLLELGILAVLAFAFSLAIYLLRRAGAAGAGSSPAR